ncbi:gluconokinase [Frigidibacter oleivorans]|uniref:gluconokinase n=1 Tax=Frigidibacter oleivorans TaxID=2487129 RepID=UPI000F8CEC91|nr:gluconokinase [Frigidibacter oleivorans]
MSGRRIVVAGVSASGKTLLGRALADRLGARFVEGDDFHPPENRAAMAAGRPLDDAMRAGWLAALGAELARDRQAGADAVLACSALKRGYRDRLRLAAGPLAFLCLAVPEAELRRRIAARRGHFMPPALLASQLATWEPPAPDEADCHLLDGSPGPAQVLARALDLLAG